MSTFPLRTLCLCVKLSRLSLATRSLSTFGTEPGPPVSPLLTTLARNLQLTENKAALSPFPATLTRQVKPKSFVCHSYKKTRGVGYIGRRSIPNPALHLQLPTFRLFHQTPVTSHESPDTSHRR